MCILDGKYSVDPDQLVSSEANWSGYTLFAKQDISWFSRTRVKKETKKTNKQNSRTRVKKKQEAHGPRVAHLSDIATADMQMLCNIFSSPVIAANEKINLQAVLNFEEEYYIWHDSQWSMIIWTNSQSHFNSRINVKFGGNWLVGFWRIMT